MPCSLSVRSAHTILHRLKPVASRRLLGGNRVPCAESGNRGFTLLEVVIALAVIGVVMAAIHSTVQGGARTAAHLNNRTLAHWIGSNKLVEMRLAKAWPRPGRSHGQEVFFGRTWRWDMEVLATPEPDMRRVELTISLPPDRGRGQAAPRQTHPSAGQANQADRRIGGGGTRVDRLTGFLSR